MAEPMIRLESISKSYELGEVQVEALRSIDMTVDRGEFVILVGPSGSGKTTLLNLVGGLDRPSDGRLTVDGQRLDDVGEEELTDYRATTVGFIFQFFNLIPTLTAQENVQFAMDLRPKMDGDNPQRALQLLTDVGLGERAQHFPAQLSGGEQQRVAIARAIANEPPLLLCDEPTGNLDLETARSVLGTLQQLKRERDMTILLVTHNRAIGPIADRVMDLRDGTIARQETNAQPASSEDLAW